MLVTSVLPVFAASSYQTYTYTTFGISAPSPDAYTPYKTYHAKDIGLAGANLDNLTDIEVDDKNNVYLADPGNNRILILDPYLQYKSAIQTFVNEEGIRDKLAEPNGVFVTAEKIFVADTNNSRIVVFDRNGSFLYQLREPQSTLSTSRSRSRSTMQSVSMSFRPPHTWALSYLIRRANFRTLSVLRRSR